MSDLYQKYRADFVRIADEVWYMPGDPRKVFSRVLNNRIIVPLRQQNVDEDIICELRDEAFRVFENRRAVNRNRNARKQQAAPYKQINGGNNEETIRYGEPNEIPRVNGVRR